MEENFYHLESYENFIEAVNQLKIKIYEKSQKSFSEQNAKKITDEINYILNVLKEYENKRISEKTCPICLDELKNSEKILETECGHSFFMNIGKTTEKNGLKAKNESKISRPSLKKSTVSKSPLVNDQLKRSNSKVNKPRSSLNSKNDSKNKINFIERNKNLVKGKVSNKESATNKKLEVANSLILKNSLPKLLKQSRQYLPRFSLSKKISKKFKRKFSFLKRVLIRLKLRKNLSINLNKTISDTRSLIEDLESSNDVQTQYSLSFSDKTLIEPVSLKYYQDMEMDQEKFYEVISLNKSQTDIFDLNSKSVDSLSLISHIQIDEIFIEECRIPPIDIRKSDSLILEEVQENSSFKESDFEVYSLNKSDKEESYNEPNLKLIESLVHANTSRSEVLDSLTFKNRNNNRSYDNEDESTSLDHTAEISEKIQSDQEKTQEIFEENFQNLYQTHKNILTKYLEKDQPKESASKQQSKVYVLLPTLFDKHGVHLVKLFSNKIDDSFLPSYVDSRLVGECLYQLDQRVFNYIFQMSPLNRRDISDGYQPLDTISTLNSLSYDAKKGRISKRKMHGFMSRYKYLMKSFKEVGYKQNFHPNITAYLIMKYGLYPCLPIDFQIHHKNYSQFELLFRILIKNLEEKEKDYLMVLYLCLLLMAFDDQEPIFRYE
ncbi:unnamed protein product [Brachionus calyciflorus]|uniref:Speriolin C-terminal domain-containing protein n=1 Tax=Brachionus calyciflorus TaxID=104777 RepID=A0A813VXM1_9BILA|nr:unnamed protein product [Brachionus calyciflorus]